jgi:hypothetical protein
MPQLYNHFFERLPVRRVSTDSQLDRLIVEEIARVRRIHRISLITAALLAVLGFLSYYLPIDLFPHLFPATVVNLPLIEATRIAWSELLWCVILTMIELYLLVLLNIAGVHEIAVATGFINPNNKSERSETLLGIGLEKKTREVNRYGIDPFQGLNKWALLLYNLILRLKGWLATQVIRYLLRLLLGRYAVRTLLNYSGMPIYMALNAYSVHNVLREARVVIMGQTVISQLMQRLPTLDLSNSEKDLLYDTLQYIAISKRDFHLNHYLLTRNLLEFFSIPVKSRHDLSEDYIERLKSGPGKIKALCQLVILLGFILDGKISFRERFKIRKLNRHGIIRESIRDVERYSRDYLNGSGVNALSDNYLSIIHGEIAKTAKIAID